MADHGAVQMSEAAMVAQAPRPPEGPARTRPGDGARGEADLRGDEAVKRAY